jgi:glycine hydroxymethyltransferase
VGHSAFPREIDYAKFAEIGNEVGALLVADIAHLAGLIAGKVMPNPFDNGFHVLSSTTHKTLRGPRGGLILSRGTVSNPLRAPEKTIENIPTLIDRTVFPGMQGGPIMNIVSAKAVAFQEALEPSFKDYAEATILNAKELAGQLMALGCSLVTGGTDNHLIVIDVQKSFGLDGGEAEAVLDSIGLTLNKNAIPDDTNPPFKPSGIRLGTPAITTRGAKQSDMEFLARWITNALRQRSSELALSELRSEVRNYSQSLLSPETL